MFFLKIRHYSQPPSFHPTWRNNTTGLGDLQQVVGNNFGNERLVYSRMRECE